MSGSSASSSSVKIIADGDSIALVIDDRRLMRRLSSLVSIIFEPWTYGGNEIFFVVVILVAYDGGITWETFLFRYRNARLSIITERIGTLNNVRA
uniref:Uncharacterized protein n=1 Tax=Romanomermis culicivorax TaxID=13658 RepID=A0A915JUU9_ROMCU